MDALAQVPVVSQRCTVMHLTDVLLLLCHLDFTAPTEMTLERGEKLEHMEDKAEALENQANMFSRNATKVKVSVKLTSVRAGSSREMAAAG